MGTLEEKTTEQMSIFTPAIDAEHLKKIARSGGAKAIKRRWIKEGYDAQISLYGVITDKTSDESHYSRIEVLSDAPYTERTVALLYDFFRELKPPTSYSIWIYSKERDSVKQVGKYGRKR